MTIKGPNLHRLYRTPRSDDALHRATTEVIWIPSGWLVVKEVHSNNGTHSAIASAISQVVVEDYEHVLEPENLAGLNEEYFDGVEGQKP